MTEPSDFPPIHDDDARTPGPGHAVIALIRDRRGRLLLQLRDDLPDVPSGGEWSLFGGGVEQGEDLRTAMGRELAEELGVTIPADALRPYGSLTGAHPPYPRLYVFDCTQPVEPADITLGEGAGFAFLTAAQCARIEASSSLKKVLTAYFRDIAKVHDGIRAFARIMNGRRKTIPAKIRSLDALSDPIPCRCADPEPDHRASGACRQQHLHGTSGPQGR